MGALASAFSSAFAGPRGTGTNADGTPYRPKLTDAAALGQAIDNAIPNAQDLSAEAARAGRAETTLQQNLDQEGHQRQQADTALGTRVDTETQARTDSDAALGRRLDTLSSRVDGEVTARETGDGAAAHLVDLEAQARASGDDTLGKRIDALAGTSSDGDVALGKRIDGETATRIAADGDLGKRIDAQGTALGKRVDTEILDRAGADAALGERIDDETSHRIDAETALGSRIDAQGTVFGKRIEGEASDRIDADAALGSRIDAQGTALGERIEGEASHRIDADAALGARIDQVAATQARAGLIVRPGDSPELFTGDLATPNAGLPASVACILTPSGRRARMTGAGIVAALGTICPEPNRLYKARYVIQRQNDTADPAGDGVAVAVAWYDAVGLLLPGTSTVVAVLALTVAMGRRQFIASLSRNPTDPATLPVPAGAVYGRPYVQAYGDTAVTDIEVVSLIDVTDGGAVSVDVDDIADRQTRLEERQAAVPGAIASRAFRYSLIFG